MVAAAAPAVLSPTAATAAATVASSPASSRASERPRAESANKQKQQKQQQQQQQQQQKQQQDGKQQQPQQEEGKPRGKGRRPQVTATVKSSFSHNLRFRPSLFDHIIRFSAVVCRRIFFRTSQSENSRARRQPLPSTNMYVHLLLRHVPRSILLQRLADCANSVQDHLHPAIVKLGLLMKRGEILGSDNRCELMLSAFCELIESLTTPPQEVRASRGRWLLTVFWLNMI
jgi:hypothetical protein